MTTPNPFLSQTASPLVAIQGQRCGYLQVAMSQEVTRYSELDDRLFQAARSWAGVLEAHGAPRVYWIALSEVVRHLHIHLYPRWPEDILRGLPLFEARDTSPQPAWSSQLTAALSQWANIHQVSLLP